MAAKMRRDGRKHLKQRADGRYAVRFAGKFFMGWTEDEAYEKMDEYALMLAKGEEVRENPTVLEYSTAWLPRTKVGIGKKTYNDYAVQIDKLNQAIGEMLVKEVRPSDIKGAYKCFEGMSESTIRRAKMLWSGVFESAVADGICRANPVKDRTAQPHKGTRGTHRAITEEERGLILRTEHRMRLMALAMLYAGLRRGEALGILIERDVDFERETITVRESVTYNGNVGEVHEGGKTENAVREIPLLPQLRDELKGKEGRLFVGDRGEVASETAFRRGWESYLGALGRERNGGIYKRWWGKMHGQDPEKIGEWKAVDIRPHDLRHSFCTMLRDAGVDMKVAMQWMGHADEKMILRIYDHSEGRIQREREKLEAFSGGGKEEKEKEKSAG